MDLLLYCDWRGFCSRCPSDCRQRFYNELWNRWQLDLADEIVSGDLRFRGSLGTECRGRDEFKHYAGTVRKAFPDWNNRIDEILAIDDRVVTRMMWTGTHRGALGDILATGRRIELAGAAFFRLKGGLIGEAWVVGDTQELWRGLGILSADGPTLQAGTGGTPPLPPPPIPGLGRPETRGRSTEKSK